MKENNNRDTNLTNKLFDLEKIFAANQISKSDYLMWKSVYSGKRNKENNERSSKKVSREIWQK